MKYIFNIIIILTLYGCTQNNVNKQSNIDVPDSKKASNQKLIENSQQNINYDIIEEFIGKEGLYSFKAPKGLFKKSGDVFISEQLQAKIIFTSNYTDRFDEKGFFSKKDLIKKYKNRIKSTYFLDKNDWFVLSGINKENSIVYLKGFYDELSSMQGRDMGEPSWLWSKSGVLEIQYTYENKEEFDHIIPIIMKSFKCDFSYL